MIADSHSHLDAFGDELPHVLADARQAGVELIVTVGMDPESSANAVAAAASDDMVFAAVGLHPWLAQDHPDGAPVGDLEELARQERVVAIGEIGLDFVRNTWRDLSYDDPELQRLQEAAFRAQLRLARRLGLPVILHSRGAHPTTTRILGEEGMDEVGGCVQFFEGTPEDVRRYVDLNFTFSVGSSVTHPDPGGWLDTVRSIPADALMLESDAPYLPYAGKDAERSAPADLVHIGEAVARIRGVDPTELFAQTARNARRAFPGVGAAR